jgi:hypothetical protein
LGKSEGEEVEGRVWAGIFEMALIMAILDGGGVATERKRHL